MKEIVLIAGTNFIEAAQTAAWFKNQGAAVYAVPSVNDKIGVETILKELEMEGRLDYLILQATEHTAVPDVLGNLDYSKILQTIENNLISSFELLQMFLPLLRSGKKRIGLITSADTSIRDVKETKDYGYAMSQAGLHMIYKIMFNKLRPEGFTFRCFCPGPGSGISAGEYMSMDFCYDVREDFAHSEENFFIMRDGFFREIPW